MSMEFRKLIDKEDIILDSYRLAEWKRNAGKAEMIKHINELVSEFIATRELTEFEDIDLLYDFAKKLKDRL